MTPRIPIGGDSITMPTYQLDPFVEEAAVAQEEMSDWDGIRSEILDTDQENDPIEQEYGEYVTIHDRFQVLTRYPR